MIYLLSFSFPLLAIFTKSLRTFFDRLWGFDSDTTISVVEVYVSKIRKKLKGTTVGDGCI